MDFGALLLIGVVWLVLNALRKAGSKPPAPPAPPRSAPGPLPPVTGTDATQREGRQLEELLRQLGRTLDKASGPKGRAPDRGLPTADEVEDRQSLEVSSDVRSLERSSARSERVVVDQDEQAEQVVARRLAAAEQHSAPRTRAEHQAFDARIRQEPADKTATRAYSVKRLREAVVWREILGPPVSLQGEGEDR